MHASKHFAGAQRGISLIGLIFVMAILGAVFVVGMKVVPAYMEYRAIHQAIAGAKLTNGTPRELRNAFDKNAYVNDIEAITGKDLIITKDTGETQIAFAYEKKIPLVANVSILIAYSGTTDKSGVMPEKPVDPQQG